MANIRPSCNIGVNIVTFKNNGDHANFLEFKSAMLSKTLEIVSIVVLDVLLSLHVHFWSLDFLVKFFSQRFYNGF